MSTADALAKALLATIGENSDKQQVTEFIDTGYPTLNKIISGSYDGGLPFGRLCEMYGPSSSGKTALATEMMVSAQKMGGVAGFMDHERSFDVGLARGFGLNDQVPYWIYKTPVTWEESNLQMAKAAQIIRQSGAIADTAPILFVLDSIAACVPKSVAEKEITDLNMNDTTALARVTSTTLKSMAQYAERFNFTVLYLNQIRTAPGVIYGDPTRTPGGVAMEFYATVRIALGRKKIMGKNEESEKAFLGQEITMKCTKSKMTKPFQETSLRMMFDDFGAARFDVTTSLIEHLIDRGKLQVSGAWVAWTDGKKYQKKALAEKIDGEGLFGELKALLV